MSFRARTFFRGERPVKTVLYPEWHPLMDHIHRQILLHGTAAALNVPIWNFDDRPATLAEADVHVASVMQDMYDGCATPLPHYKN